MKTQTDLFGNEHPVHTTSTAEIRRLMEKYPAIEQQRYLLYWFSLKEKYAWVSQLSEEQQNDLKEHCSSIESIRRRGQEFISSIPS